MGWKTRTKIFIRARITWRADWFLYYDATKIQNLIESNFYAQYPGVEVVEVPNDYAAEVLPDIDKFGTHVFHYKLAQPDPYPIKTYLDYQLDQNPKEEEKIDPLSGIIETMGSLGPKQHMWMQYIIVANKKYDIKSGQPHHQARLEKRRRGRN